MNKQQQPIAATYLLLVLYCVIVSLGPLLFLFTTAVSTADPLTGEVIRYDLSNFEEVFYDSYYAVQIGYTLGLVAGNYRRDVGLGGTADAYHCKIKKSRAQCLGGNATSKSGAF